MKIAFIADIHGNYPALSAVLSECGRLNCDRILSLGDLAGYYCMLNECAALCREHRIVSLLGNHDHYLLTGARCPRSTTANLCLAWQKDHLDPAVLPYLSTFRREFRTAEFHAVHGGWHDPLDEYIRDFDFTSPPDPVCRIFCSAHSHIQKFSSSGDVRYFNPGSVGQPRDGDPRAAFAILEDGRITLRRVAYDIDRIADAMRKAGFADRYFVNLYEGLPIATFRKA